MTVIITEEPKGIEPKQAPEFITGEVTREQTDLRSLLGTEIFTQVEFPAGRFFNITDVNKENPIDYEAVVLQTVLVEVTQTKNIITTAIQGRNGTVKEFVSDGDYVITLTGSVIGETVDGRPTDINGFYPEVDVNRLIVLSQIPGTISVISEYLQQFGINDVVVTDFTFSEAEGSRDMQPFKLMMLSDTPIDLNELETPTIINLRTVVEAEPIILDQQLESEL